MSRIASSKARWRRRNASRRANRIAREARRSLLTNRSEIASEDGARYKINRLYRFCQFDDGRGIRCGQRPASIPLAIWYTYPQLLASNAASAPGSNFNQQGGSIFDQRQQARLMPHPTGPANATTSSADRRVSRMSLIFRSPSCSVFVGETETALGVFRERRFIIVPRGKIAYCSLHNS